MPTSRASAIWEGTLQEGTGRFTAGSGAFESDYAAPARFEGAPGTNPEELLAAAHAACFSMALAAELGKQGTPPTRLATTAACSLEKTGGGFTITQMDLAVRGTVPGIDANGFRQAAEAAKAGCPVSRALAGIPTVELTATLE